MNARKPTRLQVLVFFILRPRYYPELLRRIQRGLVSLLVPRASGQREDKALDWARVASANSNLSPELLDYIVGHTLERDFPEEIHLATQQESLSPVQMGWGASSSLIYSLCEYSRAKTVVETGVAQGFSTLALLLSVTKRGGHVYSVDMPAIALKDSMEVGVVVPKSLRSAWTLVAYPDSIGLPNVLSKLDSIDLCHYDSDKSYDGRRFAYQLLWSKLRAGGVFISDDIGDNMAFRDFSAELKLEPLVLKGEGTGASGARYVGILIKQ